MADNKGESGGKSINEWKPGSQADEVKDVAAKGDFGVPAGSGTNRAREYTSENTKISDPGAAKPRSGEDEGLRTTGAGANADQDGEGSGGDVDPDVIGFGAGGAVSATGPDYQPGADDTDGSSDEMASGGHAKGERGPDAMKIRGSVMASTDGIAGGPSNQGADAASNPAARGDDSFAGEISNGEASGEDLGMSPSSDTQGLPGENEEGGKRDD